MAMRRVIALSLTGVGLLLAAVIAANAWVVGFSRQFVHDRIDRLPDRDVALVLGTSPFTRYGSPNLLFDHRINAAVELLRAGRVRHLLLSGANPDRTYNEPRMMYQALARAGVPDSAMTMDFAGFRTLDSIVRAQRVFGLDQYTIVSQRFHDFRAVFIARYSDIDAVAYTRIEEDRRQPLRTEAREFVARAVAVLDLFVLHSQPRFLGERRSLDITRQRDSTDRDDTGR